MRETALWGLFLPLLQSEKDFFFLKQSKKNYGNYKRKLKRRSWDIGENQNNVLENRD